MSINKQTANDMKEAGREFVRERYPEGFQDWEGAASDMAQTYGPEVTGEIRASEIGAAAEIIYEGMCEQLKLQRGVR